MRWMPALLQFWADVAIRTRAVCCGNSFHSCLPCETTQPRTATTKPAPAAQVLQDADADAARPGPRKKKGKPGAARSKLRGSFRDRADVADTAGRIASVFEVGCGTGPAVVRTRGQVGAVQRTWLKRSCTKEAAPTKTANSYA